MGRPRLNHQALGRPHHAAPKTVFGPADLVTAIRLPLAAAFPFTDDWRLRLAIVVVAGASDVLDGYVARRMGGSKLGAVLDPIADKTFMITAFVTLVGTQGREVLTIFEFVLVLSRDIAATGAFIGSLALRRPMTVPARLSGKIVTMAQFFVLVAIVMRWPIVRPLAWTTGALSAWAIADYFQYGRAEARRRYGPK
jgi:cardiolipin synthase